MKILYVITGLAQGGAERVVCDLADKMYEKGHEVKIAYLLGDVLTKPRHSNIELIKINLNHGLALPGAYIHLAKLIKHYQPDVVHSHMVHANLLTRLVRLTSPIQKLVSTAHNSNEGGALRMMLYRLTHRLSSVTTNVSREATQAFEQKKAVPVGGMKTIHNGIDFDRFSYDKNARDSVIQELNLLVNIKIILAVGRFSEQKDYPNLLHSIALLKEKNPEINFKLLIAGDGELRPLIEALISQLTLSDNVILLGRRSDIPRLMSACNVFVLSSIYEGLPTVLIEAIASQANIVSTQVSGAKDIINIHGEIVPIRDTNSLYQAIFKSLNNSSKNYHGYLYVKEKFDLNNIAKEWLDLYKDN